MLAVSDVSSSAESFKSPQFFDDDAAFVAS